MSQTKTKLLATIDYDSGSSLARDCVCLTLLWTGAFGDYSPRSSSIQGSELVNAPPCPPQISTAVLT
eukprot:5968709-Amphidinium_carterae.1